MSSTTSMMNPQTSLGWGLLPRPRDDGGRTARDAGVEALAPTQRNRRAVLALLRMVDASGSPTFILTEPGRRRTTTRRSGACVRRW